MDKRRDSRFAVEQDVTITTLGKTKFWQTARIKNASESGLGLLVERPVAPGTPVRIECEDDMLLGEVMYCRDAEQGHFIGVQLEQMLRGLIHLREIFREYYGETEDAPRKIP